MIPEVTPFGIPQIGTRDGSQGVREDMPSAIVTSGKQKGEFLPLGRRTSVMGPVESLSLQKLDDRVSQKHLRVCFDETSGSYRAGDMASKHGTFINSARIDRETVLREGNEILIGHTFLLFADEDVEAGESALEHYKKTGERSRLTRPE
jgi:pSer/pThr/pTyr-binding forkhead associated (FHA) protein